VTPRGTAAFREAAHEIINRDDPIGLIGLGSPPTEYECIVDEAARILQAREPLLRGLNQFVAPHFGTMLSRNELAPLADELQRAWAAADDPAAP
jgi:hypothetical protein